jgi:hypothetical protein
MLVSYSPMISEPATRSAAKERVAQERAHFDDAKTVEAFYATRKRDGTDNGFCWK